MSEKVRLRKGQQSIDKIKYNYFQKGSIGMCVSVIGMDE